MYIPQLHISKVAQVRSYHSYLKVCFSMHVRPESHKGSWATESVLRMHVSFRFEVKSHLSFRALCMPILGLPAASLSSDFYLPCALALLLSPSSSLCDLAAPELATVKDFLRFYIATSQPKLDDKRPTPNSIKTVAE